MERFARLELVKDLVQETVDRGVTSVETIHQAIADVPFEVLAALGVPDPLALRARQRRVLGLIYGVVRDVNRYVGEMLSDQFETLEDGRHVAGALGPDGSVSGGGSRSRRRL
jgi:hypothetical protein